MLCEGIKVIREKYKLLKPILFNVRTCCLTCAVKGDQNRGLENQEAWDILWRERRGGLCPFLHHRCSIQTRKDFFGEEKQIKNCSYSRIIIVGTPEVYLYIMYEVLTFLMGFRRIVRVCREWKIMRYYFLKKCAPELRRLCSQVSYQLYHLKLWRHGSCNFSTESYVQSSIPLTGVQNCTDYMTVEYRAHIPQKLHYLQTHTYS